MIPATAQPLVEELLSRCAFPRNGEALDCAVSGGPDSTALLILARAAGCQVTAHHVDHGLRDGSEREAEVVAATAAQYGADFLAHTATIDPGANLEARAREARFALLPEAVATGHTLDDRAETVLINLLRGAGRTGLSPLRESARHPIVQLRRAETVELCQALEVTVVTDPSNQDPAFLRNRVRHELLPLMDDLANRDIAALLDRQADVFTDEDLLLDSLAAEIDPTDAKAVAAAPPALARRAVRSFITKNWSRGHSPGVQAVERVLAVARGAATSCEIEGGHRIHRTNQKLRLVNPTASVTSS